VRPVRATRAIALNRTCGAAVFAALPTKITRSSGSAERGLMDAASLGW
jgi:hypothetical protein